MTWFPWSELGLPGPADERAIRRAYAARLKIVRPDVDAAGFQQLVKARDIALRMMESVSAQTQQRPIVSADLAPKWDESRVPDDTPRPDRAPDPLPAETAAPVIVDIEPPEPPPPAGTEPDPRWPGSGFGSPMSHTADPEAVSKLLSAFVTAWTGKATLPPVATILKALAEQSMVARQKLEIEALRTVAVLLDNGLFDRKERAARQTAARDLIVGLDDEYAWTLNDRRLHAMMPFKDAADQIARLLRIVREWQRTGVKPNLTPPSQKSASSWLTTLGVIMLVSIAIKGLSSSFTTRSYTPNLTVPTTLPNLPQAYAPAAQPNHGAFFFSRGVAFDRAGEVDKAIKEYDLAILLDPKHALAFYNRGLDYASKGRFDRAIEDYDKAIRLNPNNPDNFVSRGVAFDAKGDYDLAIHSYDEAIRLKPAYGLAFVNRGIAYTNKEQYGQAIKDYNQAIRLDANDRDALRYRGEAKRASGDISGGDADIAKADQLASSLSATVAKPGK